ncbi:hypothetical protein OIU74_030047 [Salix koriyanagi]|uniref:Uncharacterized protein n=1 Tax=Salix koriyanagi TaxID=2511006 RepID=A0A9Q0ZUS1_9ROSI|nr:hypothetical protein OIU74_030047 [Salix koriyanagi]
MNPIFTTFIVAADLANVCHHQNFLQVASNMEAMMVSQREWMKGEIDEILKERKGID